MAEKQDMKDELLLEAWRHFLTYDSKASKLKKSSNRLQLSILILGVSSTFFVVLHTQVAGTNPKNPSFFLKLINIVIILIPIGISILAAYANQFKKNYAWVFLRNATEDIKSEIYYYRTLILSSNPIDIRKRLSLKISEINERLMETDVNKFSFPFFTGDNIVNVLQQNKCIAEEDDGYSPMTPDQFIRFRLNHQKDYYICRTKRLEKQLKYLQALIYIFGGIGTFLAAIGLPLWVALTTALAGTLTTYLEYQQIQNTLILFNKTVASLKNMSLGWMTNLTEDEKKEVENIKKLVDGSEQILKSEHSRWVHQTEDTFKSLQKEIPPSPEKDKEKDK